MVGTVDCDVTHVTVCIWNSLLLPQQSAGPTQLLHEALLTMMVDPPLSSGSDSRGGSSDHGIHCQSLNYHWSLFNEGKSLINDEESFELFWRQDSSLLVTVVYIFLLPILHSYTCNKTKIILFMNIIQILHVNIKRGVLFFFCKTSSSKEKNILHFLTIYCSC